MTEDLTRWLIVTLEGSVIYPHNPKTPPERWGMDREKAEKWGGNLANPVCLVPAHEYYDLPDPNIQEEEEDE